MSWTVKLVTYLRYVINDIEEDVWTDEQLEKFLGISAVIVGSDLMQWGVPQFSYDPDTNILDPDPTNDEYSDIIGMLIVVRAACLIATSEMKRAAARSGFIVVDDKSKIETKGLLESAKTASDKYCQDYTDATENFKKANAFSGAKDARAILTPYASINGDPFIPSIYRRRF